MVLTMVSCVMFRNIWSLVQKAQEKTIPETGSLTVLKYKGKAPAEFETISF